MNNADFDTRHMTPRLPTPRGSPKPLRGIHPQFRPTPVPSEEPHPATGRPEPFAMPGVRGFGEEQGSGPCAQRPAMPSARYSQRRRHDGSAVRRVAALPRSRTRARSVSVQGPGVKCWGWVRWWDCICVWGCVGPVGGAGGVRAGAQPYLGPRSGVCQGRRHDGRWGDPAGGSAAAARSMKAVHVVVAAGACREPAAGHRYE